MKAAAWCAFVAGWGAWVAAFAAGNGAGLAPDRTLQERIDAAAPGETVVVGPGTHAGSLVISKPLRLIGEGMPHLRGTGSGRTLSILAPDVTVRGFRISGSGLRLMDDDAAVFVAADRAVIEQNVIEDSLHGIYLKRASDCRVEGNRIRGKTRLDAMPDRKVEAGMGGGDCDVGDLVANRRGNGIHQWNCERNVIRGNAIADARDGIYFSFTNHCLVEGNRVTGVRYGLHYMYSNDNRFVGNTFSENAAGAALMFSQRLVVRDNRFVSNRGFRAYGLIFQSVEDTVLEGNRIERNAVGLSFNQCNRNRVVGNRIAGNYIGLRFGSNSDENAFSLNRFERNLHPVEATGQGEGNRWAVAGVGNRWEGAADFDLDRDRINDLPHRELDLFGVLRRDFPAVGLLSESPVVRALRFAHQRAALPGLHTIEDPAPLSARFRLPVPSPASDIPPLASLP